LKEHLLFFNDDSGAPHHHQPMLSDKVAGQYNTKPLQELNCNTTVNVLMAGNGWIRPGKGMAASFCGVHF
jgi:hypothetical protein